MGIRSAGMVNRILCILTFAAELAWSHMIPLLEYTVEVGEVFKSHFGGNVQDGGIGGGQKPGSHGKSVVPEVVRK